MPLLAKESRDLKMTMYDGDAPHRAECAELHAIIRQSINNYTKLHNQIQQLINEVQETLAEHKSLTEDSRTHAALASSFDARAVLVELDAMRRFLRGKGFDAK